MISCPEPVEDEQPATIGMVSSPATVGEYPREVWKYWPRKVVAPNMPIPTAIEAMIARPVVRSVTIDSGMIGDLRGSGSTQGRERQHYAPPTYRADSRENHA